MESFSTVDIFDTKGTEYLFIIAYLLVLIAFWGLASRKVKFVTSVRKSLGALSDRVLSLPQGIFYSKNHTWAYLEQSGEARVGMDSLLQNITGEVRFNKIIEPGREVKKGNVLTEIEHEGKKLKISAPIGGEILEVNPLLNENHELLREEPYQNFWIYKMKPDNWKEDTKSFLLAEEASKWIRTELDRFKDFLAESMARHSPNTEMFALQEGGELRSDTLSELPGEIWEDFQKDFLDA